MSDLPPVLMKVTQFARIDGAMMRLIKAVGAYEAAMYTSGERGAMAHVLREAAGLKRAFEEVARQVNDAYAAGQGNEQEKGVA